LTTSTDGGPSLAPIQSRRIVVHDYSGHPFQVQLSRALAGRGHVVQHQHCSSYQSGHGRLSRTADDPDTLSFRDVRLTRTFARYSWGTRISQEVEYALRSLRAILAARPDVVVLCNIPLLANIVVAFVLSFLGRPYVFWHQDVYSAAIRSPLVRKLGPIGLALSALAERGERMIALKAGRVVAITEAFLPLYERWSVPPERTTVIPNWAPVDDLPMTDRNRDWLRAQRPRDKVALYSGTIGYKHDPGLLLALAQSPALDDCTVVAVTQGKGREWLEEAARNVPDGRMVLHDYVPYDLLPEVLGSADVLLAVLEPDASTYSVPSKMLTYMCAGRPIVAVMDEGNVAARTVLDGEMGYVVPSGDRESLVKIVRTVLDDPEGATRMGLRARSYAERAFDIGRIAEEFEIEIEAAMKAGSLARAPLSSPGAVPRTGRRVPASATKNLRSTVKGDFLRSDRNRLPDIENVAAPAGRLFSLAATNGIGTPARQRLRRSRSRGV
jgi:colanic acid biosynthesis glycosyl transferase WcaI